MKRLSRGFTLIELLIVVAIIGILAAIAVPNFLNAQVRAKVAKAQAEMRSLQGALEAFYVDNGSYPPMCTDRELRRQYRDQFDDPELGTIDVAHIALDNRGDRKIFLTTPVAYISTIPFDPFRGDGNEYAYGYGSCGGSYYIITSWGPDQQEGLGEVGDEGILNEWQYTGARLGDRFRKATRESNYTLPELVYDPSNGIGSAGEIVVVGP